MPRIKEATLAIAAEVAKRELVFIYPKGLDEEARRNFWDGEKFKQVPEEHFDESTNYFMFNTPMFTIEESSLMWVIEDEGVPAKDSIIAAERHGVAEWSRIQKDRSDKIESDRKKLIEARESGVPLKIIDGGLTPPIEKETQG